MWGQVHSALWFTGWALACFTQLVNECLQIGPQDTAPLPLALSSLFLFWVLPTALSSPTSLGEHRCLASNVRRALSPWPVCSSKPGWGSSSPFAPLPSARRQPQVCPELQLYQPFFLIAFTLPSLCPACSIIHSVFSCKLTLHQLMYVLVLCKLIWWANIYLF